MADEFGQRIEGLHEVGDAVVATHRHIAVLGKNPDDEYAYLSINSGGLLEVTGGITYEVDSVAGADDSGVPALVVRVDTPAVITPADGDYTRLQVNNEGMLWVTGDDFDIRALDSETPGDNVYIKSSTGTELLINNDGSINVNAQLGGLDSIYSHGSATLVKDTINTVVTVSPGDLLHFGAMMVSGAGYCEWELEFGTTGSEVVVLKFWTTPAHPTHYVDLPDYLEVDDGETIRIRGTNREKKASPASDFTGYASLIRKA